MKAKTKIELSHRCVALRVGLVGSLLGVLAGCSEPPEPRTIYAFEQDKAALDAKLLECFADSKMLRTDIECKNARLAASKIARAEREARQSGMQQASARQVDARRQQLDAAAEAQRLQKERLIALGQQKLDAGLPITEAEALALGLDPENSVFVVKSEDQ
ncbi:MAG: EexN family lipoprotein [Pseudomonadota bacterium]